MLPLIETNKNQLVKQSPWPTFTRIIVKRNSHLNYPTSSNEVLNKIILIEMEKKYYYIRSEKKNYNNNHNFLSIQLLSSSLSISHLLKLNNNKVIQLLYLRILMDFNLYEYDILI